MQCCECCGFFDDRALSGPPRVLTTVSSSSNHIRAAVDVLDPNLQAVISHQRIHASMRASSQPSRAGTQLACPIRARPSWPRRAPDAAGSRRTRMQMAPETVGACALAAVCCSVHRCRRCCCSLTPCLPPSAGAAAAGPDAVGAAWLQLKQFTEAEFRGRAQQYLGSAASRALLRDALLVRAQRQCHPCGACSITTMTTTPAAACRCNPTGAARVPPPLPRGELGAGRGPRRAAGRRRERQPPRRARSARLVWRAGAAICGARLQGVRR